MSTVSNSLNNVDRPEKHSTVLSPVRPFLWSVKRELWEFRSIYIAPIVVAAIFLFGFFISLFVRGRTLIAGSTLEEQLQRIQMPYNFAGLALMGTTMFVSIFYCLEALHGERRDRSILFWKSLPVSDMTAVLAKASIPLVILPLLTVAIAVAMHCVMLPASMLRLSGSGQAGQLWNSVPLLQLWLALLIHMVVIHSLWFAPFYGWMLLVSAWARRAALLWAFLPLLVIVVVERVVFGTWNFVRLLMERFSGAPEGSDFPPDVLSSHSHMHMALGDLLLNGGLWAGLAVTAVFLFLAARLRRQRGPI